MYTPNDEAPLASVGSDFGDDGGECVRGVGVRSFTIVVSVDEMGRPYVFATKLEQRQRLATRMFRMIITAGHVVGK